MFVKCWENDLSFCYDIDLGVLWLRFNWVICLFCFVVLFCWIVCVNLWWWKVWLMIIIVLLINMFGCIRFGWKVGWVFLLLVMLWLISVILSVLLILLLMGSNLMNRCMVLVRWLRLDVLEVGIFGCRFFMLAVSFLRLLLLSLWYYWLLVKLFCLVVCLLSFVFWVWMRLRMLLFVLCILLVLLKLLGL